MIRLSPRIKTAIRKTVDVLLSGKLGGDHVHVSLPKKVTFTVERFADRVELTWQSAEPIEAVLPFVPDPNILSVAAYRDHTRVTTTIGTIKVDH